MKNLNRKVFIVILSIFSFFLILGITIFNYQIYDREYKSIEMNLNMLDSNRIKDFDNMKFLDYDIYTVIFNNNEIIKVVNHNYNSSEFDVDKAIKEILSGKSDDINLYLNNYVYKFINSNVLIIINTTNNSNKLKSVLGVSIIIFVLSEILMAIVSFLLTEWITKPARDAFQKQKDFIADASHELKTPLAVIMASSDSLKVNKDNSKYLDNIKFETDRMNKLISSLLELSKLENAKEIEMKNENLSKIVEKIALTFESVAFEETISIDTDIESNITLKCNKEEIEKVISILIDNAIKHSDKNTNINVCLYRLKNNICIKVINDGEGINPGEEELIFERFYRSDKSRNRDANRYGLGLAIAKNIINLHNGTIKAYSKDNKTTFEIIFK